MACGHRSSDHDHAVQVVMDRDVAQEPWYGCSDGTTTGYLNLATEDVLKIFLPSTGNNPSIISI